MTMKTIYTYVSSHTPSLTTIYADHINFHDKHVHHHTRLSFYFLTVVDLH